LLLGSVKHELKYITLVIKRYNNENIINKKSHFKGDIWGIEWY